MLSFQFETYQRPFRQPLRTSRGSWQVRQGIIISLTDEMGVAKGEIAPLPWFGSETLAQGLEFCQQLNGNITTKEIYSISDRLPACQFAFESALLNLSRVESNRTNTLNYCHLLPAGKQALTAWQNISQPNSNTFKWKIGVLPIAEEIAIFKQLIEVLPPASKLRLDANGGLNVRQARQWLEVTQRTDIAEFIEQPLSPDNFAAMLSLSQEYDTAIALDESVASFNQLQEAYQRDWRGIFVIKAAIMGYPNRLLAFCREKKIDAVFSSVFETKIGRQAVLELAAELKSDRAVGFGVNHWF